MIAQSSTDIACVKALFLEYLDVLKTDFNNAVGCASGEEDVQGFPDAYVSLLLAKVSGAPMAACGLKHISANDCELGKLYCRPEGRGNALGQKLTNAAIEQARALGYGRLVLSTEPVMKHAALLYEAVGFKDITNYAPSGDGCSRFMALDL